MSEVFVTEQRLVWSDVRLLHVGVELVVVGENLHPPATENVRGSDEDRKSDFVRCRPDLLGSAAGQSVGHPKPNTLGKRLKPFTVARLVHRIG